MLVGDQDRVEVGQAVPAVAEVAGVDQDPGAVGLGEHGGMSEVGDPHGLNRRARPRRGGDGRLHGSACGEQVPDQRAGPAGTPRRHVEVGDRADHDGPERRHAHALLGRRGGDRSGRPAPGVEHDDVGLHGRRVDRRRRPLGDGLGERPGRGMIIGQPGDMVVERVRAPAASIPACRQPPPSRLRSTRARAIFSALRPAPSRPGRPAPWRSRRSPCRTAAVVVQRDPGGDVGVPQPGAVEVVAEPMLTAQVATAPSCSAAGPSRRRSCGCSPPPPPRSTPGAGPASGAIDLRHPLRVEPAALGGERPHGQAVHGGVGTQLGAGDVRLDVAEHLLAGLDQQPHAEQVGQRAR